MMEPQAEGTNQPRTSLVLTEPGPNPLEQALQVHPNDFQNMPDELLGIWYGALGNAQPENEKEEQEQKLRLKHIEEELVRRRRSGLVDDEPVQ